jgi:hypothetical protein
MYYTHAIMYERTPTAGQINELQQKGYKVVINTDPEL